MSSNNKNNKPANIDSINPIIQLTYEGRGFSTTSFELQEQITNMLFNMGIDTIDRVIITPHNSTDSVGIDATEVKAYFVPENNKSVYWKNSRNGSVKNGTFNLITAASNGNGYGPFGTTKEFDAIFGPLVYTDNNGKPILHLNEQSARTQQGASKRVAVLELDFIQVLRFIFGLGNDYRYGVTVLRGDKIGNRGNYAMLLYTYLTGADTTKGVHSKIDYRDIQQSEYDRVNNSRRRQY